MQLNTDTLNLLKAFSTINQSLVFHPGKELKTMSPSKTIMAMAKIEDEIPSTFGIYDLSRFLGTYSLFSNPKIKIEDKFMTISEGKKKINYVFAEPSLIASPPRGKSIELPSKDIEFELTADVLQEVMKAISVLSLPEFAVTGDGSNIFVQALDSRNPTGDIYSVEVGETEDTFKMIINAENMKIIPGTYNLAISKERLSHFSNEKVEYFVAVEGHSTYG